jgi:hypothetical protein
MKVIKLTDNSFVIRRNGKTYIGDAQDTVRFLVIECGSHVSEVRAMQEDMRNTGNNCADFGLRGTFIFTHKVELGDQPLDVIGKMAA